MKLGFIGLGNIGLPAASNLLKGGFSIYGFVRRPNQEFAAAGGISVQSPGELAHCDVILQSLPTAGALTQTIDSLLPVIRPGQILIDLSSYRLEDKASQAARLEQGGAIMLDCEVSGLPHQVANRTAVLFTAGDAEAVRKCAHIFDALTDRHFYLGAFGAATKMKLIANLMVCVHDLMAAEALNLGKTLGLDPKQMVEVLLPSAAGSTTFTNKAPLMASRDFGAGRGPFRHMFGYLERAQQLADRVALPAAATPLLQTVRTVFDIAQAQGRHDQDIAAVIEIIEQLSQGTTS